MFLKNRAKKQTQKHVKLDNLSHACPDKLAYENSDWDCHLAHLVIGIVDFNKRISALMKKMTFA